MFYIPYNSRKEYHKSPFGAVAAGEQTTFRLILPREVCCRGVQIVLRREDGFVLRRDAAWDGMQGEGEEWWRICVTVAEKGLYWYHFTYETDFGSMEIRRESGGIGRIAREGSEWQLTVYDPAVRTPDWICGGVLYQIFPDRFCDSGRPKQTSDPAKVLRDDWGGAPQWEPDARGRIRTYDFFGGDLEGIRQKLPYLASLGVTCVYLNPIFEARSNHRYDTGDYARIDRLLGDETDFRALCDTAHALGMRVLLDGVFSHTGDDSRYFNKYGRYDGVGAYQSAASPYYSWYKFTHWPDSYESWWGIDILPEVREDDPSFCAYISDVARKWLSLGADGWRLDVADELTDDFLDRFYETVKDAKPDAYILGEVWEDASCKISYGSRRRYLMGGQMDSVMNYPFAKAIVQFLTTAGAEAFMDAVLTVLEHYPPYSIHTLMNHIGTHDTARALTRLAAGTPYDRESWKAGSGRLTSAEREKGLRLLRCAALMQYTLPGVPCVYYGDEAGMEGGEDPFNRGCFPWDGADAELTAYYRRLAELRRGRDCFRKGDLVPVSAALGCVAFARQAGGSRALVIVNRNAHPIDYYLPPQWQDLTLALGGSRPDAGTVHIGALEGVLLL